MCSFVYYHITYCKHSNTPHTAVMQCCKWNIETGWEQQHIQYAAYWFCYCIREWLCCCQNAIPWMVGSKIRPHLSLQLAVGGSGLCLWSGSFNLISGLTLFWQTSSIQYSINLKIYTVCMSNRERCLFESEPACTCFRVDDVDFAHTCLAESLAET